MNHTSHVKSVFLAGGGAEGAVVEWAHKFTFII